MVQGQLRALNSSSQAEYRCQFIRRDRWCWVFEDDLDLLHVGGIAHGKRTVDNPSTMVWVSVAAVWTWNIRGCFAVRLQQYNEKAVSVYRASLRVLNGVWR
jgi:hypothetical protein